MVPLEGPRRLGFVPIDLLPAHGNLVALLATITGLPSTSCRYRFYEPVFSVFACCALS